MASLEEHLEVLGLKVKDKVTEFEGIAESISFDLYGCIQVDVRPIKLNKEGQMKDGQWFDLSRLKVFDGHRVMDIPDFKQDSITGPADKPNRL